MQIGDYALTPFVVKKWNLKGEITDKKSSLILYTRKRINFHAFNQFFILANVYKIWGGYAVQLLGHFPRESQNSGILSENHLVSKDSWKKDLNITLALHFLNTCKCIFLSVLLANL
jgi:hypothetical protein